MKRLFLALFVACSKEQPAPAPAASNVVEASAPQIFDTHSAWWAVAQKSKVYTNDRLVDADNRLKMLPIDQRRRVVAALDDMAKQPATAEGFHDAAERARGAQDHITDPNSSGSDFAPVFRAIAETGLIVLHGLVAKACEHPDPAALKTLAAAV